MDTDKKTPFLKNPNEDPAAMTNEEWEKVLPADVYHIAREKGTERAGTGKFYHIMKQVLIIAQFAEILFS